MGTPTEKFLAWFFCATALVLAFCMLSILVAPLIRQFLFASPLWSAHVKAQVQEAYIVGSSRPKPHSYTGLSSGPDRGVRNLKYFLVVRYQYGGKTYIARTTALYNEDASIPGSRGAGSDEEYFRAAVERLRQAAPNTAYAFIQTDESMISGSAVKDAMAGIPEGAPQAEMDVPILKWAPGWNYYNLPFTDRINHTNLMIFLAFFVIFGSFSVFILWGVISVYPDPKDFFSHTWPGWALGLLIVILFNYMEYGVNNKPRKRFMREIVPSSRIHRS